MPTVTSHKIIVGSEKKALPNAKMIGEVDPKEQIEITLLVRPRSGCVPSAGIDDPIVKDTASTKIRRHINHKDFTAQHGADPADIQKVKSFARAHMLTIVETSIAKRSIKLAGTVGRLTAAFKLTLKQYQMGHRHFRGRTGGISIPIELSEIVVGVFGIDDRSVTMPRPQDFRGGWKRGRGRVSHTKPVKGQFTGGAKGAAVPLHLPTEPHTYSTVDEVARRYNFPKELDGSGQCIAIIELNDVDNRGKIAGTGFRLKDLKTYFKTIGKPMPRITAIGVNGGANKPGHDRGTDGEVMLDIEVAGTVAPRSSIAVYFAPNNDRGFIDAVKEAVHDRIRKPSVISISWALCDEEWWTKQARNAFSQILQDAAVLGVTVCCASGDSGSDVRDVQDRDGRPHLIFPASDPNILACGGTEFRSGARERAWKEGSYAATGGGVSAVYARPSYQSKIKISRSPKGTVGRGVPDVAGYAAGYRVKYVGGKWGPDGGTSAVSPLWAGLIALINQRLANLGKPRAGFINPLLYQMGPSSGVFHDIVHGDNDTEKLGMYKARKGWDACTGLGTPDGTKLMEALGG